MRTVLVARDPIQAHLVAGLLRERGIACEVVGEMAWTARGEAPADASTAPCVVVGDSDHARAMQVLGEDLPGGACRR